MRIAAYIRISTEEQNIEMQLADLHTHAGEITDFIDEGFSGSLRSRPALDRTMTAVRNHEFDAVLVWKFDRFARSTTHLLTALEEFDALGVQFISHMDKMDTSTPAGKLVFSIMASVAQFERDLIRERTISGIRHAQSKGIVCGRTAAVEVTSTQVKELRNSGMSLMAISKQLGIGYGTVRERL